MRKKDRGFILDAGKWMEACDIFNMWMSALIRCGQASRFEIDCVLDVMTERLLNRQVVSDSDYALEFIRKEMTFAIFAGLCFAKPEDAATAGANSVEKRNSGLAYRRIMENFALARKNNGFIQGVEFRIAAFADIYNNLPAMLRDRTVASERKKSLSRWQKEGEKLVPDI